MIQDRKVIEENEKKRLASYAVKSIESKGRKYTEDEDGYRTCFQRDVDRVIYCMARRRLAKKTQVFFAGHGDHFRTRASHTDEVVRIARSIARTLNLNEDLAEAIALAHDLGHPCFGHKGESVLNEILKQYGGHFEHNEQSLWVVERLEYRSSHYLGLNLTFEVRDGLNKHRTPYDAPVVKDLKMPSLEAQIVNIADEIAYKHHDIDDGLRAGVLKKGDLENLAIYEVMEKGGRSIIELMVNDLLVHTEAKLSDLAIQSVQDVYEHSDSVVCFSDEMGRMIADLGYFLEKYFYQSKEVTRYNDQGEEVIRFLFDTFYNKPEQMPRHFAERLKSEEKHIVVKDYIAGMTDTYAIERYEELKN